MDNYGTDSEENCDYPNCGEKVANALAEEYAECGILNCGTGAGIVRCRDCRGGGS